MTHDIDEVTGLPVVPEGYFWRVRRGALEITWLELQKKTWYGGKTVDKRVCHYYSSERAVLDPREEILSNALSIMQEFNDPWIGFYGDYPPKSIKEKQ